LLQVPHLNFWIDELISWPMGHLTSLELLKK
jgi:hypothetical protein